MTLPNHESRTADSPEVAADFLILAKDADGVGPRLLEMAHEHWDYTDRFTDALIFRGPMLSDDATRHAGSLHLLRVADAESAQRFAREEPYHRAGLFSHVEVVRFSPLIPPVHACPLASEGALPHAFVQVRWAPRACPERVDAMTQRPLDSAQAQWLLLGLLMTDAGACKGVAGVTSIGPVAARATMPGWLQALGLPHGDIEVTRWRRGGRR